ncbi:mitochondrial carrier domain-containing protein [Fusarium sp. MPI-SDFR-AT-0072]|nr:mitochondrial carrier domain-containing protein [Fusarium sp. MPI-SDFR-AT-0072]
MSITMKPSSLDSLLPSSNKYPFWFGGSASAIATLLTHPLDLVRGCLQSTITPARLSMAGMTTRLITTEGYARLYAGLSAAIVRQFTYSTIRFGVHEDLKSRLSHDTGTSHSPMVLIYIVNVRMQSDMSRPLAEQRNYKHVFDGVIHITRTEVLSSLCRGVGANALRASLMNSSQLASYDMAKSSFIRTFGMNDDTITHLVASFLAGIVATTVCSPVDVVKIRIMGSTNGEHVWQISKRSTLSESPLWVFNGWVPSFLRLGPHTVLTLLILEQHKKLYAKMGV